MFMIVLYHCCKFRSNGLDNMPYENLLRPMISAICSWGLTLFIVISGFFLGKKMDKYQVLGLNYFLISKAKRLLIPYLVWGLLLIVLFSQYQWYHIFLGIGHLWFLLMLFELMTVVFIWKKANINNKFITFFVSIAVLAFHILFFMIKMPICSHNLFFLYLPYFLLGILMAEHNKLMSSFTRSVKFMLAIIICVAWQIKPFTIEAIWINAPLNLIMNTLFCISILSYFDSKKQILDKPNVITSIVSKFSEWSFGIYIIHVFILTAIENIENARLYANNHYLSFTIILFITCIISSSAMTWLIEKSKIKYLI